MSVGGLAMTFGLLVSAAWLIPAPALGQASDPATPVASERRLSPDQIEAVLAEAARKREASQGREMLESIEDDAPRQIRGEVGVSVGTGGYREVFGTAFYPMGDDGAAAISLDFTNLGKRRDRR